MVDTTPTPATPVASESSVKVVVVPLSKSVFKSWTIWFNIVSAIIVVLNQISPFSAIVIHDTTVARNVSDLISALIVIGNILLRFKTNSKVTLK